MGIIRNFLVLGIVALTLLSVSSFASALYTNQKSVVLDLVQGQGVKFYLYMEGSGTSEISRSGDIDNWISNPSQIGTGEWLEVAVDVPKDAAVKTYYENIKADGSILTKMTVIVREPVTSRLDSIDSKLKELDKNQDTLLDDQNKIKSDVDTSRQKINTLEVAVSEIKDDVEDIAGSMKDTSSMEKQLTGQVETLQSEVNKLESENKLLESEKNNLNQLTGMATVNSSGIGFIIGAVIGVFIAVLYFRGIPGNLVGGFSRTSHSRSAASSAKTAIMMEEPLERPSSRSDHDRIRRFNEFKYDYKRK